MMMGIGLSLATLGAILRYAVDDDTEWLDVDTVGLIMMIVGTIAFATGVMLEVMKRPRQTAMPFTQAPTTPPPGTPPSGTPPPPPPQSPLPPYSQPPHSPPPPPPPAPPHPH
ncbi:MAG TPA: hypothetical protein VF384_11795 [Planctomycetota bacterium]